MKKDELSIYESPAVIKHLEILQDIITRMAGNGAACKTWAIPVITGIIAFSVEKQCIPIWVSLIPAIMFFVLDSFYHGLERHFIDTQKEFVAKLSDNTLQLNDIYVIKSIRYLIIHLKFLFRGMLSFATGLVYIPIIALILWLWKTGY